MNEELRNQINEQIIIADEYFRNKEYDKALEIYNHTLDNAKEMEWHERILNIQELIKNVQNNIDEEEKRKEQEINEEKKEEEREKERKRLEAARQRLKKKEQLQKEEKIRLLKEKKQREDRLQNEAYELLGTGSEKVKNFDYEKGLEDFNTAKTIFEELNWITEIRRANELIEDAKKEFAVYRLKKREDLEKEEQLRQAAKKQEERITTDQEKKKLDSDSKLKLDSNKREKELHERELSEKAMELIDKANKLVSNEDFDNALKNVREAKKIFQNIAWRNEADKTFAQISHIKTKQKEAEIRDKRKQEMLKKKVEEEENFKKEMKIKERIEEKRKREEQEKLQKQKNDEEYSQSVADNVFSMIDTIEEKVKKYEKGVKKGEILSLECPYLDAIETYKDAKAQLFEIGWIDQSNRMNDGLIDYQQRLNKDNNLRKIEQSKIEKKEKEELEYKKRIEASERLKKKQKEKELEKVSQDKKIQDKNRDTYNLCLILIDDANKKRYNKEFDEAISIYEEIIKKYNEINYTDGIRLAEESLLQLQNEQIDYQKYLRTQEELRAGKEKEQKEIQLMLEKSDEEKKRLDEEKNKKLNQEKELEKKKEETYELCLDLIDEANNKRKNNNYEDAIKIYQDVIEKYKQIAYQDGIRLAEESLLQLQNEKDEYQNFLKSQKELAALKLKEEEELQKLLQQSAQERKQKRIEEINKLEQEKNIQKKKEDTYELCLQLIDDANFERKQKNFAEAIKIYQDVIKRYKDIEYTDGVRLAEESLLQLQNEEIQYQKVLEEQKRIEELKKKDQEDMELLLKKSEEVQKVQELRTKAEKEHQSVEKFEEEKYQNQIIDLMIEAGEFVKSNNFDSTIQKYEETLPLFEKVNWPLKEQQVKELIIETKKQKESYLEKQKELKEKKEKEQLERKKFEEYEIKLQEQQRQIKLEQRNKQLEEMNKQSKVTFLEKEAWKSLETAETQVNKAKYISALYSINISLRNFTDIEWSREAGTTKKRLNQIYEMIDIPLISRRELFETRNRELQQKVFDLMAQSSKNRKNMDFHNSLKNLIDIEDIYRNEKWTASIELVEKAKEKISKEYEDYKKYLAEKDTMPSLENAMKLMDEANSNADKLKYEQAMNLAKQAKSMLIEIGNDREAKMIQQNIIRWKYKLQKVEDQIRNLKK